MEEERVTAALKVRVHVQNMTRGYKRIQNEVNLARKERPMIAEEGDRYSLNERKVPNSPIRLKIDE